MLKIALSIFMFLGSMQAWAGTPEQPDRNEDKYNLEAGNLGLKGYDPVAYFEDFGGDAMLGDPSITTTYGGVTYRFVSKDNMDAFNDDPTRFEPTYGGWCAWARALGQYADIDPMLYTQNGNRMHFFISNNAKRRFDRELAKREADADDSWEDESGETPRL